MREEQEGVTCLAGSDGQQWLGREGPQEDDGTVRLKISLIDALCVNQVRQPVGDDHSNDDA